MKTLIALSLLLSSGALANGRHDVARVDYNEFRFVWECKVTGPFERATFQIGKSGNPAHEGKCAVRKTFPDSLGYPQLGQLEAGPSLYGCSGFLDFNSSLAIEIPRRQPERAELMRVVGSDGRGRARLASLDCRTLP